MRAALENAVTPFERDALQRERTKEAVAKRGRAQLATLIRLAAFEERGSLTVAQREERREAQDSYNAAIREVGLEGNDPDDPELWTVDALRRLDDILARVEGRADNLQKMINEQDRYRAAEPAWMRDMATDDPSRRNDPIRELIGSGERFHDFAMPEGEAVRNLPDIVSWENPAGRPETRAIADFSDSSALYVDDFFASAVSVYARTLSPYLGIAHVVTSTNGRPLVIPDLTTDSTVYTPGEGTAITESSPTLGSVTVTPVSYKALTYVSHEAYEDASFNISDLVAREQGRAVGLAFGSAATTAILTAATNAGTATGLGGGGTATFIGYEDLIDAFYSQAAPYRAASSWVFANGLLSKARKWTNTYGEYLWQPAIAAGQPLSFEGRRVYEDPYLAAPASATKSVLVGDFNAGVHIKMTATRVAISDQFRFDTDQIAIKSVIRAALAVPLGDAIRYVVCANS